MYMHLSFALEYAKNLWLTKHRLVRSITFYVDAYKLIYIGINYHYKRKKCLADKPIIQMYLK